MGGVVDFKLEDLGKKIDALKASLDVAMSRDEKRRAADDARRLEMAVRLDRLEQSGALAKKLIGGLGAMIAALVVHAITTQF